jgi:hypothetical protein
VLTWIVGKIETNEHGIKISDLIRWNFGSFFSWACWLFIPSVAFQIYICEIGHRIPALLSTFSIVIGLGIAIRVCLVFVLQPKLRRKLMWKYIEEKCFSKNNTINGTHSLFLKLATEINTDIEEYVPKEKVQTKFKEQDKNIRAINEKYHDIHNFLILWENILDKSASSANQQEYITKENLFLCTIAWKTILPEFTAQSYIWKAKQVLIEIQRSTELVTEDKTIAYDAFIIFAFVFQLLNESNATEKEKVFATSLLDITSSLLAPDQKMCSALLLCGVYCLYLQEARDLEQIGALQVELSKMGNPETSWDSDLLTLTETFVGVNTGSSASAVYFGDEDVQKMTRAELFRLITPGIGG